MLIGMHVVPFLIGEPHIDGEPGDLKFIIKELRYSSVDLKSCIITSVVLATLMIASLSRQA